MYVDALLGSGKSTSIIMNFLMEPWWPSGVSWHLYSLVLSDKSYNLSGRISLGAIIHMV